MPDLTIPVNLETSHRHLHALCINPAATFDSQQPDEKIIMIIRAHPVTWFPWIGFTVGAFIVPFFFNIFLTDFFSLLELLFINIFYYSGLFSYAFVNFLLWAYNVGIVTNHRVLDIDYISVLQKETSGATLDDVTDVSGKTTGFLRAFIDYGDLFVQTAGITQNIEFRAAPEPNVIVSILSRVIQERKNLSQAEHGR